MKNVPKALIFSLTILGITGAAILPSGAAFVLGQRYVTTIRSAEQGEIKLPLLKTTAFCKKYICRELESRPDQSPDINVYEWLEEDFTAAEEAKYLSTLTLGGRYGIVRNVSAYSYKKDSAILTVREIKAFQELALAISGLKLQLSDINRCNAQLIVTLREAKTARCTLSKGTLITFDGKKVAYQIQLTGDKDPSTGKYVSGLNAWL